MDPTFLGDLLEGLLYHGNMKIKRKKGEFASNLPNVGDGVG